MNGTSFKAIMDFANNQTRIYKYNDISIYYMLQLSNTVPLEMFKNTFYIQMLEKLHENDKEHSSNLIEILYCYLYKERSATEAGKLLNMHRNNVLYHIGRICELTGLDLDDYWVRMKLLLGFHYLELAAANKITS